MNHRPQPVSGNIWLIPHRPFQDRQHHQKLAFASTLHMKDTPHPPAPAHYIEANQLPRDLCIDNGSYKGAFRHMLLITRRSLHFCLLSHSVLSYDPPTVTTDVAKHHTNNQSLHIFTASIVMSFLSSSLSIMAAASWLFDSNIVVKDGHGNDIHQSITQHGACSDLSLPSLASHRIGCSIWYCTGERVEFFFSIIAHTQSF